MAKIMDQLQGTAIKVIHSRITDVLLNVVYETANTYYEYADAEVYGEALAHSDLVDEINRARALYKKLPEILKKPLEERAGYTAELEEARKIMQDKFKTLFVYRALCQNLFEDGKRLMKLRTIPEEVKDLPLPSHEEIADTVIAKAAQCYDIPYVTSKLLSRLPMRMAKGKFDEFVSLNLEALFEGMSAKFMKNCKETFFLRLSPLDSDSYGRYFPLIKQSLDEHITFDINAADDDALFEYNDMIDDLEENIDCIQELLNVCFNIVNYLDILTAYAMDDKYAYYDNAVIKDLMYACADLVGSDSPEALAESVAEQTSDLISQLYEETRGFEDTLQDTLQLLNDEQKKNLPSDCRLAIDVYNAIVSKFMQEITDEITAIEKKGAEPAGIAETDAAIKEMIDRLNEKCEGLAAAERKKLKQRFIELIPVHISPEELHDYIIYSLEGVSDEETRLIAYGDILETLDEMGLLSVDDGFDDEDDEHHEHHHDHEHDCDCGHEHKH
ncbi:MAG: hypothetical protein IJR45_06855 [Firmicutes bacterium]|nr:hypothetical protein [Bacillota bacterium]MBQ9605116.1 hypothetical protein [Bacillota bacterium]